MFGFINNKNSSDDTASLTSTPSITATTTTSVSSTGYKSPYLDPEKDLHLSEQEAVQVVKPVEVPAPQPTPVVNVTEQINQLSSELPVSLQEAKVEVAQTPQVAEAIQTTEKESVTVLDLSTPEPVSLEDKVHQVLSESPDLGIKVVEQELVEKAPAPEPNLVTLDPEPTVMQMPAPEPIQAVPQEIPVQQPEPVSEVKSPVSEESVPSVGSLDAAQPQKSVNPAVEMNPEKDLMMTAEVLTTIHDQQVLNVKDPQDLKSYLDLMISKDASDLHLTVGYPAKVRIDGTLHDLGKALTVENIEGLVFQTLNTSQKELLDVNRELDLSYNYDKARFRVNAYHERGNLAAAYRLIPNKIRSIDELRMPPILHDFTTVSQGLFLVTGPTGSGKSTTIAGMIQEINEKNPVHIITIEDPIEYVYPKSRALVDQRELGQDTHDWHIALRSILRQDPDVVVIGEMRDFETIQLALTIAETGHLVFATLHTNSSAETIDRIIDVFPPHQQQQVRLQLASTLKGVLSQRLIPVIGGGRQAATELLIVNSAVQNLIREAKVYQIDNVISTSYDIGMYTLEKNLVKMIREGKISVETAQEFAIRPKEVLKMMKSS